MNILHAYTPALDNESFNNNLIQDMYRRHPNLRKALEVNNKATNLASIIDYIIDNIGNNITLDQLEMVSGKSKFDICRLFNQVYNITPMRWIWRVRITLAKEIIHISPNWSLTDICYACGFSSLPHFSRCFTKTYKIPPLKYRKSVFSDKERPRTMNNMSFDIIFGKQRHIFSRAVLLDNIQNLCN
ncbi:AraC family transcriptional regulator [Pectobacteriaceae bacterium CE70]|nr:AraC family transcriptional regulator [Prodigiosinella sp. LS101]WJV58458.1 AraC family transcriptional regulator [Pectobacteriaceae bacterium C111]WJV62748.1 AraC family transcriptional regulator [Pectobacteriaceae bacterium C52]WJV67081.1 AraC family transcriptional regulator [Pectobacteriaceae bacterium CE70]WJY11065.1 AraC family transcriptional regulator [Pectobacteriaceae bacterium C80]WJY14892.1 AraC family transcriptional regulator [Pectobacteriaceae bacterium CE90]